MKRVLVSLFLSLLLTANGIPVFAQQPENAGNDIPERNGDFPDPKHPGVRVRVFVHEPRVQGKPTPPPPISCTDLDSSSVISPAAWKLPAGNWTYKLNTSSVPQSVGSNNLSAIAGSGFGVWSAAVASSSSKPVFVSDGNTTIDRSNFDGLNIITWGRITSTALAITYVRYYPSTGMAVDLDIIMNKKYRWSWTNPTANQCSNSATTYDAQNIMTHEIGHWMGLNDEYTADYVDNTMYGYGATGEIKKNTLTSGDIIGVRALYP